MRLLVVVEPNLFSKPLYIWSILTLTATHQSPSCNHFGNKLEMGKAAVVILLKVLMILLSTAWLSLWLLKPTNLWTRKWKAAESSARNTVFGYYGKYLRYSETQFFLYRYLFLSLFSNMIVPVRINSQLYITGLDFTVYTFPVIAVAMIGLVYLKLQSWGQRNR